MVSLSPARKRGVKGLMGSLGLNGLQVLNYLYHFHFHLIILSKLILIAIAINVIIRL